MESISLYFPSQSKNSPGPFCQFRPRKASEYAMSPRMNRDIDSMPLPRNNTVMDQRELKDLAWIGDAVLALYARQWLLEQPEHPLFSRQELFMRFTKNAFLQTLGEPTRVEAEIGMVYRDHGLKVAFEHIQNQLHPLFEKHLANAGRGRRGQKRL